jgi:F0F1-type ATP synthase delta subunit
MLTDVTGIIAKKYAAAFVHIYQDALSRADVIAIKNAGDVLQSNSRVLFFFKISVIPEQMKQELILNWLYQHQVPSDIHTLVDLLLHDKRLSLLGQVLQGISLLWKQNKGIMPVVVRTSHPVSPEQKMVIECYCKTLIKNKTLEYSYKQDPRLQVGICVQSSSLRWEKSLRSLLHDIRSVIP